MVIISKQLDISFRLTPQVITIICDNMKKYYYLKKIQKYGELYQNSYINKNDT